MGKTFTGGSKFEKNIDLLSKDQKRFLSDVLTHGTGAKAKRAYQGFLEEKPELNLDELLGPSRDTFGRLMQQGDDEAAFKKGVVDPMMQQYTQQVLPGLQQRFTDANAGSSSALNQALAASANDLTTQIGSFYLPFKQSQQQTQLQAAQGYAGLANPYIDIYKQANANKLAALSGVGALAGQQTFTPLISQSQGIGGPLIQGGAMLAAAKILGPAAVAASSEKIKENIKPYEKGLKDLKKLNVKIYDYKKEYGGKKDNVGVIAEKVPQELTDVVNGILSVDLYGLIGLLINSVKELSKKIDVLEGKCLSQ